MDTSESTASKPRFFHSSRHGWMVFAGIAACVFLVVLVLVRTTEQAVVLPADFKRHLDDNGRLRPLAQFAEAVQTLKLVTVVVDDTIRNEAHQEHWRGDVHVSLDIPVRYQYGVNLSELEAGAFSFFPGKKVFHVMIPSPQRLSTEVYSENATNQTIEVGLLRTKSRAGTYLVAEAYKNARQNAERHVLPTEKKREVEEKTKAAVEDLASRLARQFGGENWSVSVSYAQP